MTNKIQAAPTTQNAFDSNLASIRDGVNGLEGLYALALSKAEAQYLRSEALSKQLDAARTYDADGDCYNCPLCESENGILQHRCSFHESMDALRERYYETQRQLVRAQSDAKGDNTNNWVIKLNRAQRDWLMWTLQIMIGANKVAPFHLANTGPCAEQIWGMVQQEVWRENGEIGPRDQMSHTELAARVAQWKGEDWAELRDERNALKVKADRVSMLEQTIGVHRIQIDALRNGRFDIMEKKMREQTETIGKLTIENQRLTDEATKKPDPALEQTIAAQAEELTRLRKELTLAKRHPLTVILEKQSRTTTEEYLAELMGEDPEEHSTERVASFTELLAQLTEPWMDDELRGVIDTAAFYYLRGRHRLRLLGDCKRRLTEMTEFADAMIASLTSIKGFLGTTAFADKAETMLDYQIDVFKAYLKLYKLDQAPRAEQGTSEEEE